MEQLDAEICDEVYETYTDLLTQREDDDDTLCYKTYTLVRHDSILKFTCLYNEKALMTHETACVRTESVCVRLRLRERENSKKTVGYTTILVTDVTNVTE